MTGFSLEPDFNMRFTAGEQVYILSGKRQKRKWEENDMNQDLADIRALDDLLRSLYIILKNEKNPETRYAERTIGRMGNNIGTALSDEQADICELFLILKSDYKSLFPPRDGLTGFYIRRDDLSLQHKLNSDYKNILLQIKAILDRH